MPHSADCIAGGVRSTMAPKKGPKAVPPNLAIKEATKEKSFSRLEEPTDRGGKAPDSSRKAPDSSRKGTKKGKGGGTPRTSPRSETTTKSGAAPSKAQASKAQASKAPAAGKKPGALLSGIVEERKQQMGGREGAREGADANSRSMSRDLAAKDPSTGTRVGDKWIEYLTPELLSRKPLDPKAVAALVHKFGPPKQEVRFERNEAHRPANRPDGLTPSRHERVPPAQIVLMFNCCDASFTLEAGDLSTLPESDTTDLRSLTSGKVLGRIKVSHI